MYRNLWRQDTSVQQDKNLNLSGIEFLKIGGGWQFVQVRLIAFVKRFQRLDYNKNWPKTFDHS